MNEFDLLWKMMDEFMECECDKDFKTFDQECNRRFAAIEAEFYRQFFHTLKKTIDLCHAMECCEPPQTLHISLIQAIECTPQKKPAKKKRKKSVD